MCLERATFAKDQVDRISEKYEIDDHDTDILREISSYAANDSPPTTIDSPEEVLEAAGFELVIVNPHSFRYVGSATTEFPAWVKDDGSNVVVSLCKFPELYADGVNQNEGISKLLDLMYGFCTDINKVPPESLAASVRELRSYLRRIFFAQ